VLSVVHVRRAVWGACIVLLVIAGSSVSRDAGAERPVLDVIYVPTPEAVVDAMLDWARVGPQDFLIDLGSGDGRIPIAAAKRFGTRGFGVDIDPTRVEEATANARAAGVGDKVTFAVRDLFETNISEASVLTLYLSLSINGRLRARILTDLRPGSRVLSHAFDMGTWAPDRVGKIEGRTLYLWIVPASVSGTWRISAQGEGGEHDFTLELTQDFQAVRGNAVVDGRLSPVSEARLEGDRFSFVLPLGEERSKRFEGRVVDGRMEGQGWHATRSGK